MFFTSYQDKKGKEAQRDKGGGANATSLDEQPWQAADSLHQGQEWEASTEGWHDGYGVTMWTSEHKVGIVIARQSRWPKDINDNEMTLTILFPVTGEEYERSEYDVELVCKGNIRQ